MKITLYLTNNENTFVKRRADNIDIQECTTYAIGAVEVKTGAILQE